MIRFWGVILCETRHVLGWVLIKILALSTVVKTPSIVVLLTRYTLYQSPAPYHLAV